MAQAASVGRIVHYYQGDWEAPHNYSEAQKREWPGTNGTRIHPAMVTHVHTDDCVNLVVNWDAGTPSAKTSMTRLPDEVFKPGMHCTNSGWRWPPHVRAAERAADGFTDAATQTHNRLSSEG